MISSAFTGVDQISRGINVGGDIALSLSGTWVATVVLERAMDKGDTFSAVETFTENHEARVSGLGEVFRLRVSEFTSGIITYFLGQPEQ